MKLKLKYCKSKHKESKLIIGNQYQYVLDTIDKEGFHYAFRSYSNFKEVGDPKLLKLIKRYNDVVNAIDEYINIKTKDRAKDIEAQNNRIDPYEWGWP